MEKKKVLAEYEFLFKPEKFIDELSNEILEIDPCDGSRLLEDSKGLFHIKSILYGQSDYTGKECMEIASIQPKTPRVIVELINVPFETHVSEVCVGFQNSPEALSFSQHQIINFCEKYRSFFKRHIKLLYVITYGGFVIINEDHTGELHYSMYKTEDLYEMGAVLRSKLAFLLKIDTGTQVPH